MRLLFLATITALALGCDDGTGGETDTGTDAVDTTETGGDAPDVTETTETVDRTIALSGTLVEGAQTVGAKAPGDPLAGCQLFCVTFADPPTAATGTADATGMVRFDLEALEVAFGCFVLDPSGEGLATLLFSDGLERGQTITLTEDTDFGTITVDVDNGIAEADATESGTLTGSSGFACPLGTWTVTVPRPDCTGSATSDFWITRTAEGQYLVGFTFGPIDLPGIGCAYRAEADVPATMTGDTLSFRIPADPSCPTKMIAVTATPNTDCTQLAMTTTYENCASCDSGICTCGGTLSCPMSPSTATRE